jgi:CheY-like chemotaxis protein
MGFTADAETDPLRALEMFEKDPGAYDLVVTDQTMPGLAGADLARAVLEKRPDMPVIMCTGFSETMTRERAAELGVRGYLLKPVLRKDLARAVAEVFPDNAPAASSSGSGRAAE